MKISARLERALKVVRPFWKGRPEVGLILGSGLGRLARHVDDDAWIDYAQIPHFAPSTSLSHAGRLGFGTIARVPVVVMDGRLHLYEGYSPDQVAQPVRLMAALGIRCLVITCASGGLRPDLPQGGLLAITDHINLMGPMPHSYPNIYDEEEIEEAVGLGDWPSRGARAAGAVMSRTGRLAQRESIYDPSLTERLAQHARQLGLPLAQGVYVGVRGPNYETRAEYRMLRRLGGDAVGMSVIPEAVAARRARVPVLAVTVVTNVCRPDDPHPCDGRQVVDAASLAAPRLASLVEAFLEDFHTSHGPAHAELP